MSAQELGQIEINLSMLPVHPLFNVWNESACPAAFFGLGPSTLPSVQHSPLVGVNSAVTRYILYKKIKGWYACDHVGCSP
ncbi:hypothetical protein ACLKA6_016738 [Drosophila palustris]